MRRPVLLAVVPVLLWLASSCGLRAGVDSGTAGANPSTPATTTAAGLTPPSSSAPTSAKAMPPSTKPAAAGASSTAKATFPPSTKAPTATTVAPTTAAPTTAAPPTTAGDQTTALCSAAKYYAMADMPSLGRRVLEDPDGLEDAYDKLVMYAPAGMVDRINSMGPFTKVVLASVRKGDITSPDQLVNYLSNAPRAELEQWVLAQQTLVPELVALCGPLT